MNKFYSKAKNSWIISFFAIIAIIIFSMLLVILWTVDAVSNEITELSVETSKSFQKTIDGKFDTLESVAIETFYYQTNIVLAKMAKKEDFYCDRVFQFQQRLYSYALSKEFVDFIYIYYPRSGYIVGDLGIFPAYSYYLLMNSSLGYGMSAEGYDEWISIITDTNNLGFFSASVDDKTNIYYRTQFCGGGNAQETPTIITQVSIETVKNILQSTTIDKKLGSSAILTDENGVVTYGGYSDYIKDIGEIPKFDRKSNVPERWDNNNKIIVQIPSEKTNFIYLTVTEKGNVLKKAYDIRNVLYISLLSCLIIGGTLAVIMSKVCSRPLELIVNSLNKDIEVEYKGNEYDVIRQYIDNMSRQSGETLERIEQQNQLLAIALVSRLVNEKFSSEQNIFHIAQQYNIEFEYPYFCIGVQCSRDTGNLVLAEGTGNNVSMLNQTSEKLFVLYCEIEGRNVYLFNCESDTCKEEIQQFLYTEIAHLSTGIAVGSIYNETTKISVSYQEALSILNDKNAGVMFYNENEGTSCTETDHASFSIADKTKNIIDEQYSNSELGLFLISEILGVSNSYTSKIFKKQFGLGVIEYLNRVRIYKAKQLIGNGNMNIKDIAIQVGFTSDIHFIRVFKKYEQVTPGKYKNNSNFKISAEKSSLKNDSFSSKNDYNS